MPFQLVLFLEASPYPKYGNIIYHWIKKKLTGYPKAGFAFEGIYRLD